MEFEQDKKWVGAFGIGIGMLAGAVDFSIVNTAIPAIQEHFLTTVSSLQWIMTGLGVAMTALLVTMGRLADLFGRRRFYLAGLTLFTLASLLCGFAPQMIWLNIGRVFQGIAMAIILPISLSLMVHQFTAAEKGKAIGLWTSIIGIGLAIGPVLGGFFVSFLNWRWIFFINPPIVAVSLGLVLATVAESRDESHKAKIDPFGVAFLIIGMGSLTLAIVEGPVWGWTSYVTLGCFGLALIGFTALTLNERKAATPIIPFRLFLNRMFFVCTACNFGLIFCWWTVFFLVPLYLDNLRGEAPYQMGLILLALAVPFSSVSLSMGHVATKTGPKRWLVAGFTLWVLTALGMSLFSETTSLGWILLALFSTGICFGLLFPCSTTFALATLPKRLAGTASGSLTTFQELGGTLGVAIAGTVFKIVGIRSVLPEIKAAGIELTKKDQSMVQSFLADPQGIQGHVKGLSAIASDTFLPLFNKGFNAGFNAAMLLLAAIGLATGLLVLFVMKGGKHEVVHPEDFMA